MKQLDEILHRTNLYYQAVALGKTPPNKTDFKQAKQAIEALILDIIGEDYPKDYPYDDPEGIMYFNIEKERQRAKLKED